MFQWTAANPQGGIDLADDMLRLFDLGFADDVLISGNTKEKVQNLLDILVRHLATAGLMLNTSQTVALTTEAQPLSFIQVGDNHMIKVLGHSASHRWLGSQGFPVGLCQWNFFLVREVCDSIRRTLGEESTGVESTSTKSFPWAPTTKLGHRTGNFLQVQSFGQLGKCCEKCDSMGCFASDFPTFVFHVNAAATFPKRCLQVVQSFGCSYIYFVFLPPPLHWARLWALG